MLHFQIEFLLLSMSSLLQEGRPVERHSFHQLNTPYSKMAAVSDDLGRVA